MAFSTCNSLAGGAARRVRRVCPFPRIPTLGLMLAGLVAGPSLPAQPAAVTMWSTNEWQPAGFGTNATFHARTDAAGNVFVASTRMNPAHGHTELVLFKYSSAGTRLWMAAYDHLNASNHHWLAGLEVDQAGNAYLAGTAAAGAGGGDWVVVKYSPAGARLWSTNHGSAAFDSPVGLAVDERGFVAVAGNLGAGANLRALKLDMLTGEISGPVGTAPDLPSPHFATAMALDASGNVWVTGSAGTNCLTLRFGATGPGVTYTGRALSPPALGAATGRAIAWSKANNLVFVLAALPAGDPPMRQAVLCYSNVPLPTIPLFTGWHAAGPVPGTFLKPVIVRPSLPSFEDPVALAVAPGGRVVTLAQAGTAQGDDWVVTGWNTAGSGYSETDSTLGPTGSMPTFQNLTAAALNLDSEGNILVTGTGRNAQPDADFATVRYAPLHSGTPLVRHWFHRFDFNEAVNDARALAVDVAGNPFVAGLSALGTNRWLTTVKLAQGPPLNDTCANALLVRAGTVAFSTRLATDTVPGVGNCSANRQDVWFKWTAPTGGVAEVDTLGSGFDTVLAVYTGTCGSLTPVTNGCNDNALAGRPVGTPQSFVSFTAIAGTTYLIQAGVADGGQGGGDGRLTIFGPLPALGTCPPGGGLGGTWRKYVVLGSGNSSTGGRWRLTVPGCTDLSGFAPTAEGASSSVLASNLAFSINGACASGKVRAVAVSNAVFVRVIGCPPDEPVFLRAGDPGSPLNQLCLLADAPPPGPLFAVAPPTCAYNPTLATRLTSADCNGNGVPDEVDIANGVSQDTNANSIPDECEGGLMLLPLGDQGVLVWGIPGYVVETSTDLTSATSWTPLAVASPVFVPLDEAARFFRLRLAEP